MAMELYYTCVPKGLEPDSTGFCTVAVTAGMSQPMIQKLESLGGYRPVFDVGSGRADENPHALAHWKINVGGLNYSVLSHVCFAGADHQGRFNKLAHHVVVDSDEMTPAGPAWVMLQPDVLADKWSGQPRIIHTPKIIPDGTNPPGPCDKWEKLTGDAGWAGMFAQAFILDASKPAYIIYEPSTDILPLINEALRLVPEKMRWKVTFNTYFDTLPAGLTCSWRCCPAGTPAALGAAANATSGVLIDLTGSIPQAPDNKYVRMARTGSPADQPDEDSYKPVEVLPTPPGETEQKSPAVVSKPSPLPPSINHQPLLAGRGKMLFWAVAILWPILAVGIGGFIVADKLKPEKPLAQPARIKESKKPPAPSESKKAVQKDLQQAERYGNEMKLRARRAEEELAQAREKLQRMQKTLIAKTATKEPAVVTPTQTKPPTEKKVQTVKQSEWIATELPALFASPYTKTGTGKKVLISRVPEGESLVLVFPSKVQKPFEITDGLAGCTSEVKITCVTSTLEGRRRDIVGKAWLEDGCLFWQWATAEFDDVKAVRKLTGRLKYATLRVFDADSKQILTCQFHRIKKLRIDLKAVSELAVFESDFDDCNPTLVCRAGGNWSPEESDDKRSITFRGTFGVAISAKLNKAVDGKTGVFVSRPKGSMVSSIRSELNQADKTLQAEKYRISGDVERIRSRNKLPKPAGKNAENKNLERRIRVCLAEVSRRIGEYSAAIEKKEKENSLPQWKSKMVRMRNQLPIIHTENRDKLDVKKIMGDEKLRRIYEEFKHAAAMVKKISADTNQLRNGHGQLKNIQTHLENLSQRLADAQNLAIDKKAQLTNRIKELTTARKFVMEIRADNSGAIIGELTINLSQ